MVAKVVVPAVVVAKVADQKVDLVVAVAKAVGPAVVVAKVVDPAVVAGPRVVAEDVEGRAAARASLADEVVADRHS